MGDFSSRLKKMDKQWKAAKKEGFGLWPEGKYKFQLQNCEIVESKAEKVQIKREHLCLSGDKEGEAVTDFLQLESDFGKRLTCEFIESLNREAPDSMEEWEEIINEIALAAPIYMATLKNNSGYNNVTVQKVLEEEAEKAEYQDEEEEEEESGEEAEGFYTEDEILALTSSEIADLIEEQELEIEMPTRTTDKFRRSVIQLLQETGYFDEEQKEEEGDGGGALEFGEGMFVLKYFDGNPFQGVIKSINDDGTFRVVFDDGDKEDNVKASELSFPDDGEEKEEKEEEEIELAENEQGVLQDKEEMEAENDSEMVAGDRVSVEIDGVDYEGYIHQISLKKKTATVNFDDGEVIEDIAFDEITVIEDETDKEQPEEEEGDEPDEGAEISRDELVELAQVCDVTVSDKDDEEKIKAKICKYVWERSDFVPEEVAILEAIGAELK